MNPIVTIHPEILNGTPCFNGSRVPVKILFDYLGGGDTVDEFLRQYPTVRREQVLGLLAQAFEQTAAVARVAS